MSATVLDQLKQKKRVWTVFIFLILLSLQPSWVYGDSTEPKPTSSVLIKRRFPIPPNALHRKWVENIFDTDPEFDVGIDEVWRIADETAFNEMIDKSQVDPNLKSQLINLYRLAGNDRDLFIPLSIREKVPQNLLQAIYTHQFIENGITPRRSKVLSTKEEVLKTIEELSFTEAGKRILKENTVFIDKKYHILINPVTWPHLPIPFRQEFVDALVNKEHNKGVKAEIAINRGDDLAAIAKKYAGGRDYRPIERYLKWAVEKEEDKRSKSAIRRYVFRMLGREETVKIPLKNLMPPFVRKMIDSFSDCHGPNCFNSGLNVNRHKHFSVKYEDTISLLSEVYTNYRFVKPTESLTTGDLLVYQDAAGEIVHVSSFVGDGLVFTKNGISQLNPYIFQEMDRNEKIYFPDGKYQLKAFRIPRDGEKPIGPPPYLKENEIFYRKHPDLEHNTTLPHSNCAQTLLHVQGAHLLPNKR